MSHYNQMTRHPLSGEFFMAQWIDDYFGHHNYGVKFPSGEIFDPRTVALITRDVPEPPVDRGEESEPT